MELTQGPVQVGQLHPAATPIQLGTAPRRTRGQAHQMEAEMLAPETRVAFQAAAAVVGRPLTLMVQMAQQGAAGLLTALVSRLPPQH